MSGELEIVTGPLAGRRLPLRGEVTVGRADTDLELNDAEVSRAHAVLRAQPDGTVEVEDLGSTNGTYIDDVPVIGPGLLGPGQQLLGRYADTRDKAQARLAPLGIVVLVLFAVLIYLATK